MTSAIPTDCFYAYRFFAVLLPICVMFTANSHFVIYSGLLVQIGFNLEAYILLYSPWIILPGWGIALHVWTPYKKTCLNLAGRFVLLTAISIGLLCMVDNLAFRNTKSLVVDEWPDSESMHSISDHSGIEVSLYGDSDGKYILFDNGNSENEQLIRNALATQDVEIIEQQ